MFNPKKNTSSNLSRYIFGTLGILVIIVFYLFSTKALYGNVDSNSLYLDPPYDSNIGAFELSHERSSYATMLSLDERGKVDLTKRLADIAAPDAGYYEGRFYSFFPPGLAYGGLPFYRLGKQYDLSLFFTYFTIVIYAILALLVLYRICRDIFKLPVWVSYFVVINTGLASTFLNFVVTFYQHVPSAFFTLLAYYAAYKYKYSKSAGLLWASVVWSCYGLSIFFDYPNLIIMLPILVYFLFSGLRIVKENEKVRYGIRNSLLASLIVISAWGSIHIFYNYKNFDNWKRFSNSLPRYAPHINDTLEVLEIANTKEISEHKEQISFSLNETNLFTGFGVLLIGLNKSVLAYFPMYLVSLVLLFFLREKLSLDTLIPLFVIATNLFIYASFHDPWGGWGYGPRYLVVTMPFASIYFGMWLATNRFVLLKKISALLLYAYATAVALLGVVGKNYVIPKPESDYDLLIRPMNFWSNFKFIQLGQNGNFMYNTFLSGTLTLEYYYFLMLVSSILLVLLVLFVIPHLIKVDKNQG